MAYLQANQRQFQALCKQYQVVRLSVFGSALTERFDPATSDIDLAVTFGEVPLANYADNFFNLLDSLEGYFQRKVDLIEEKAIRNPYLRQSIDATKQQINAAWGVRTNARNLENRRLGTAMVDTKRCQCCLGCCEPQRGDDVCSMEMGIFCKGGAGPAYRQTIGKGYKRYAPLGLNSPWCICSYTRSLRFRRGCKRILGREPSAFWKADGSDTILVVALYG